MRLVNDRLLSVWGYREKSESHNYIVIHKLHCTGASIIASILRRFEGPPRKKITGRRKKFVFQSVCVSTFYFLVRSFLSRNRCFSKGKNSSGVKRLVTYDSHKAEQKWHHVSQTHSALSLLLTYNALVSVLTHRPGGNLTADHRRQRTKSGKHWELHCSVRCCTSAGTDTEHTFLQEQMTDRLSSSWWFLINNAKRKGYFLFTMNMKCCVTGQLKDAWILNQWGFRVGGASETQTWQNAPSLNACWRRCSGPKVTFTRRMLLSLLVASLRMVGKLCYLSEKEMEEAKAGKGRTATPLGRSFGELSDLFFQLQ